jgi:hypothetical protein
LEVLKKGIFSYSSDVWSLGVLIWEVYTNGDVPYGVQSSPENILDMLDSGARLQPKSCPEAVSKLMLSCWNETPSERPTIQACFQILCNLK